MATCFILIVLSVCSFASVLYFSLRVSHSWKARSWPTTPGLIDKAELAVGYGESDTAFYRFAITYSYNVNGTAYHSSRISYADKLFSGRKKKAEALQKTFANKSGCIVYYNPNNPASSVLLPGNMPVLWRGLGISAALLFGLTLAAAASC